MLKAEFVALVSLKVPSGGAVRSTPVHLISPSLLWPPARDLHQLRHEVGEEGEGPHHVEDDEHLPPVRRAVDVAVADLKKKIAELQKWHLLIFATVHPSRG